ncbi:hypothetical protein Tcan_11195, partial [Toxocara canis]
VILRNRLNIERTRSSKFRASIAAIYFRFCFARTVGIDPKSSMHLRLARFFENFSSLLIALCSLLFFSAHEGCREAKGPHADAAIATHMHT